MEDEEFIEKLRQAFAVEAEEHLQAITEGLLEFEKSPAPPRRKEIIETIFREAHSLKGAGRAVDRTDIEAVCQALESIFADWKAGRAKVPPEAFDIVSAALDFVAKLLAHSSVGASVSERNAVKEMVRRIMRLNARRPAEPSPPSAVPAPDPEAAKVAAEDDLPSPEPAIPVPDAEPVDSESESVPSSRKTPAPDPETSSLAETVRVPMARMDALLLRAEEMVAVKLAAAQHAADLRELGVTLENWSKRWAKVRVSTSAMSGPVREFLQWNEGQIEALDEKLDTLTKTAERAERTMSAMVDDLLGGAKQLVMLPFSRLLNFLPKQVRDLSREEGKQVELVIRGADVEIDKRVLEEMKAPLVHLVRNAIDHGLETPETRARHGKPPQGTLTISVAQMDANKVEIVVSDDGEGIHVEEVKASAIGNGVITAEEAGKLGEQAALSLIFQSGISTSPILTEISGRGLGMAIVREKVEKLGGQIHIETKPRAGTSFRMVLPLTLATFKGVFVGASGQTFAIPISSVIRSTRVKRDEIKTVENRETISFEGHALAFAWLADVLGLPRRESKEPSPFVEVLVLSTAEQRVAFAIDEVINEQEVLVKKLTKPLMRVRNIAGATLLGSGIPVLILNVADLLKSAVRMASGGAVHPLQDAAARDDRRVRHLLVADDSLTSRMLIKNILESAGYRVTTAVDGADAFTAVRGGDFDLVVSDVEMPRMDGFEFTEKVRAETKFADLPIVLVTGLGTREHRERGIDAGANAYIVKSNFDQSNLLEVIKRLV